MLRFGIVIVVIILILVFTPIVNFIPVWIRLFSMLGSELLLFPLKALAVIIVVLILTTLWYKE